MPTVPRLEDQSVKENSLPGVRFDTSVNQEAFGGGASATARDNAVNRFGATAIGILQKEKEKADQLAVLDADTRLSSLETRIQYDPKTGAVNKRGRDVFGLYDSVSKDWNDGVQGIEKDLHNDSQKTAFKKMVSSRWASLDKNIQSHMSSEIRKYDDAVTETYLENERDAATKNFLDTERIGISIERQRMAIVNHAERNGLPDEWVKNKIQESQSKTHIGVINRLLAGGDDQRAKAYFDQNKEFLTGKDASSVENAMEEGTTRGNALRTADKIWDASKGDYEKALAEARGIDDPKTRQLTEDFIRRRQADQKAAEASMRDDIYREAATLSEQNPGASVRLLVAPDKWQALTPEQRNALERRANDPENDGKAWLDFLELSPKAISSMSRSDFETKYWGRFDSSHKAKAEALWTDSRTGRGGTSEKHASTLSFDDRVRNTLFEAKMIPDKSRANIHGEAEKTYTRFETEAAKRVEDFERTTGKKASGEDIQSILDGIAKERVKVKGLLFDKEKLSVAISENDKGSSYVPLQNIPSGDRASIENVFKRNRKTVTPEKVERAYAAYVLKDRKLFDSIMAE